jgi:hypothetical protein
VSRGVSARPRDAAGLPNSAAVAVKWTTFSPGSRACARTGATRVNGLLKRVTVNLAVLGQEPLIDRSVVAARKWNMIQYQPVSK